MSTNDKPNKYAAKYTVESWLREEYVSKNRSMEGIADELNVPITVISEHIHKFGIDEKPYTDKEWLRERYRFGGKNAVEIAAETDVTKDVIRKWINKFDLQRAYQDKEWLRKQYIEHGKSTNEIASIAGCSSGRISEYLNKFNIETRDPGKQTPLPDDVVEKLEDEEWVRNQYVEKQKSTTEIGDELGISREPVRKALHEHGIEIQPSIAEKVYDVLDEDVKSKLTDEQWMYTEYVENHRSIPDIADELDVGNTTVHEHLSQHDIETRTTAETLLGPEAYEKLEDEEWLHDQYVVQDKTMDEIADELDVSRDPVFQRIHRYGFDT